MQHDTTTYNKVSKRYKLFLHNKCCTLLYEKLGSFDRVYLCNSRAFGVFNLPQGKTFILFSKPLLQRFTMSESFKKLVRN